MRPRSLAFVVGLVLFFGFTHTTAAAGRINDSTEFAR